MSKHQFPLGRRGLNLQMREGGLQRLIKSFLFIPARHAHSIAKWTVLALVLLSPRPAYSANAATSQSEYEDPLNFTRMHPAFDHLGEIGGQLDAALASGCRLIYTTGLGAYSYAGLPERSKLDAYIREQKEYTDRGHRGGAIMLSYLCATSIVNITHFADHWATYFPDRPADFSPDKMLQQGIDGKNLPSWYGDKYSPADMWNPAWRAYTRFTIKLAVEAGFDGVFFDNPTVHMKGNYSPHAMRQWKRFLETHSVRVNANETSALRVLTRKHADLWREFRTTEAADFFREMREYGRSLNSRFLLTANNSLNAWNVFYSQQRSYAYSIQQQSRQEDLVTIEDMSSAPRRQGSQYQSYASTLNMLGAIASGRPLSICTIDGDYTTPPNMMKLAIAECSVYHASYMVWSCWKPEFREANAAALLPYHLFLDRHADMLRRCSRLGSVMLLWPDENWLRRDDCPTARIAKTLSEHNIPYGVNTIEWQLAMRKRIKPKKPFTDSITDVVVSDDERFSADGLALLRWMEQAGLRAWRVAASTATKPGDSISSLVGKRLSIDQLTARLKYDAIVIENGEGIRRVLFQRQKGGYLLQLYNQNVTRKDQYHDEVLPAKNIRVSYRLPQNAQVQTWRVLTPDGIGNDELLPARSLGDGRCEVTVPQLTIWSVLESQ